jgi:hypothetical protein
MTSESRNFAFSRSSLKFSSSVGKSKPMPLWKMTVSQVSSHLTPRSRSAMSGPKVYLVSDSISSHKMMCTVFGRIIRPDADFLNAVVSMSAATSLSGGGGRFVIRTTFTLDFEGTQTLLLRCFFSRRCRKYNRCNLHASALVYNHSAYLYTLGRLLKACASQFLPCLPPNL